MKIRLIMVMTVDGIIARDPKHNPTDWSSAEDTKLYRQVTKDWGAIIMGRSTYDAIGQPLPGRLNIVLTEEDRPDQPGLLIHKKGDIKNILAELEDQGLKKILLCGGTFVNSMFLKENLIDEIQLTIEPKIFGQGLHLFDKIDADLDLELIEIKKLNDNTINLLYKVKKN